MNTLSRVHGVFDSRQNQNLRLLICLLLGIMVAGFLTWFMFVLIQFSEHKVDASARVYILDFVRLKRDESSVPREKRAERPQQGEAPPAPPVPPAQDSDTTDSTLQAIQISPLSADPAADLAISSFDISGSEGEFMPIVRVTPLYPVSASSRGIEGSCAVEFTVTTTGATKDLRVIDERCTYDGFAKPSLAAAARFKYKPRVINGEAVEVHKVVTVFVFQLEDEKSEK